MSSNATIQAQAAWRRHQAAHLRQRHQQLGLHFKLDVDTLLDRGAHAIGLHARPDGATTVDRIRRATIEAIDHCTRLPARSIGAFQATW